LLDRHREIHHLADDRRRARITRIELDALERATRHHDLWRLGLGRSRAAAPRPADDRGPRLIGCVRRYHPLPRLLVAGVDVELGMVLLALASHRARCARSCVRAPPPGPGAPL